MRRPTDDSISVTALIAEKERKLEDLTRERLDRSKLKSEVIASSLFSSQHLGASVALSMALDAAKAANAELLKQLATISHEDVSTPYDTD